MGEVADGSGGHPAASFHVIRYRGLRALLGRAGVGLGHLALHRVEGLLFWRLLMPTLGTSIHPWPRPIPHPTRFAFFGVWESTQALDDFILHSAMARRWRGRAKETWHVRLEPIQCRGTWDGRNLLNVSAADRGEGPLAVLTYGRVRLRSWLPFWRFLPRPTGEALRHPGLMALMLATEVFAPSVKVITFSLWRSPEDAMGFAYPEGGEHGEAIGRVERDDWASEMLFARFRPVSSQGTWCGTDPLAPDSASNVKGIGGHG